MTAAENCYEHHSDFGFILLLQTLSEAIKNQSVSPPPPLPPPPSPSVEYQLGKAVFEVLWLMDGQWCPQLMQLPKRG